MRCICYNKGMTNTTTRQSHCQKTTHARISPTLANTAELENEHCGRQWPDVLRTNVRTIRDFRQRRSQFNSEDITSLPAKVN